MRRYAALAGATLLAVGLWLAVRALEEEVRAQEALLQDQRAPGGPYTAAFHE